MFGGVLSALGWWQPHVIISPQKTWENIIKPVLVWMWFFDVWGVSYLFFSSTGSSQLHFFIPPSHHPKPWHAWSFWSALTPMPLAIHCQQLPSAADHSFLAVVQGPPMQWASPGAAGTPQVRWDDKFVPNTCPGIVNKKTLTQVLTVELFKDKIITWS